MEALIIIILYYLQRVFQQNAQWVRALLGRMPGNTAQQKLVALAKLPFAKQFVQWAMGTYGRPPASVLNRAKQAYLEERGGGGPSVPSTNNRTGSGRRQTPSNEVGQTSTVDVDPGVLGRGELSPDVIGQLGQFGQGSYSASERARGGGTGSLPLGAIGHMRVGKCISTDRQKCTAFKDYAIRLGDKWVAVSGGPRRLVDQLQNVLSEQGTLTDEGVRLLAAAYMNTAKAIEAGVSQGWNAFLEDFAWFPDPNGDYDEPHEIVYPVVDPRRFDGPRRDSDVFQIPPYFFKGESHSNKVDELIKLDGFWRRHMYMTSVYEFLDELYKRIIGAAPIPQDVLDALETKQMRTSGEWSLRTTRSNPARINFVDASN